MLILLIVKDSLWALTSLLSCFWDTECWEIPWHLNIVYESHLRYSVIKLTYNLYQKNGNFKSSFTRVFIFTEKALAWARTMLLSVRASISKLTSLAFCVY